MDKTKCPACGNEISSTLEKCAHCGHEIVAEVEAPSEKSKLSPNGCLVIAVVILIVVLVLLKLAYIS